MRCFVILFFDGLRNTLHASNETAINVTNQSAFSDGCCFYDVPTAPHLSNYCLSAMHHAFRVVCCDVSTLLELIQQNLHFLINVVWRSIRQHRRLLFRLFKIIKHIELCICHDSLTKKPPAPVQADTEG